MNILISLDSTVVSHWHLPLWQKSYMQLVNSYVRLISYIAQWDKQLQQCSYGLMF